MANAFETQTALVPNIAEAEKPQDELTPFATSVDDDRNWALDAKVKRYIDENVFPLLDHCRNQMIQQKEEWKAIRRMNTLSHDEGQRYLGRSNAYIPAYARARKTLVSALSQGLFPSDEFLDVTEKEKPTDALNDNAKATKTYLQWEFEKNARVRSRIKPFLGELVDFGISVAKFWYEKPAAGMKQGRAKKGPADLGALTYDEYKCVKEREGLRFSTRSVFDWYCFPINIDDLDEATLVFEDIDVSRGYILERKRLKEWENIEEALNAQIVSDHDNTKQEQNLEQINNPATTQTLGNSVFGDIRTFTEIWCNIVLPDAAYMEDEEAGTPLPVKIVMTGDIILQVVRNPFWHQHHPYLVARDDPPPGQFFPKGTGHLARSLQYLVNDFTNQLNDNGTYALNPITLVNPTMLAGPLPPIRPGVVWNTTDINQGIKFDRPPIEQIQYAQTMVANYAGMLADFTGATPALQGSGGGKNAKTATGMQILQRNASTPLKDLIEDIENDVLTPLMFGCWVLAQQYRDKEFMAEVMGEGGVQMLPMTREQLIGNFTFRWLASSQAANASQRAQQAMSLLQILPPLVPLLMQAGWQVDPQPVLKRLVTDGLGFRNMDQFVKRAPPPMMGPDGQPMPPGAGGPPPPGGMPQGDLGASDQRSATMQGPDGDPNMQSGEGDELSALRQQVENDTGNQGGTP